MTKGRKPPNAGKGRKRGVPNRMTRAAREAFEAAFDRVGGVDELVRWAKRHPTEFYRLYARLIPVEQRHGNPDGSPLAITWPIPAHPLER